MAAAMVLMAAVIAVGLWFEARNRPGANEIREFLDFETRQTLEAEAREVARAGDTLGAVKLR